MINNRQFPKKNNELLAGITKKNENIVHMFTYWVPQ